MVPPPLWRPDMMWQPRLSQGREGGGESAGRNQQHFVTLLAWTVKRKSLVSFPMFLHLICTESANGECSLASKAKSLSQSLPVTCLGHFSLFYLFIVIIWFALAEVLKCLSLEVVLFAQLKVFGFCWFAAKKKKGWEQFGFCCCALLANPARLVLFFCLFFIVFFLFFGFVFYLAG